MGLNCKPDELCRVVGMPWTPEANDHFVTTVRLISVGDEYEGGVFAANPAGGPAWLVRGHNIPMRSIAGTFHFQSKRVINDKFLRPIRDPGDDAVDETLINNPVRHEVTA